ncbi:MAG TPA: CRISPR system precrRNA processing endoribonuclease RAMP protein Cas6 [Mycobacteriales bacterium]|nr:CRISPR system precrRNA processing endoribonuclease RAMP protein Cas6 [Mycobacteriales bacterium]
MPAIIRLHLLTPPGLRVYPARLHGAVCALLEPAWVRHRDQRKPFSTGPLSGDGNTAAWRLGWLADEPVELDVNEVAFGPLVCPVLRCDVEQILYAELAAGPPAWTADVDVISPLYFSRNGRDHPLPDPVLMLRSAVERWNAFAPAALQVADDIAQALLGGVWLASMSGATATTPVTATMHQTGFVGQARLALGRHAPPQVPEAFAALMRFADIAGLGAQTTHGFGAVRLAALGPSRPPRPAAPRPTGRRP